MEKITCKSFNAQIYLAGDVNVAKQILRREMFKGGCVNIYETQYIYTGGEEAGYVVELINYPRFPKDVVKIKEVALCLADTLMVETFQGSYTIQFSDETVFVSRRSW